MRTLLVIILLLSGDPRKQDTVVPDSVAAKSIVMQKQMDSDVDSLKLMLKQFELKLDSIKKEKK